MLSGNNILLLWWVSRGLAELALLNKNHVNYCASTIFPLPIVQSCDQNKTIAPLTVVTVVTMSTRHTCTQNVCKHRAGISQLNESSYYPKHLDALYDDCFEWWQESRLLHSCRCKNFILSFLKLSIALGLRQMMTAALLLVLVKFWGGKIFGGWSVGAQS